VSASGEGTASALPALRGAALIDRLRALVRGQRPLVRAALLSVLLVVCMRVALGIALSVACGDGHCNSQGVVWLGTPPVTSGWQGLLIGPWQRNDATFYAQIALHGYQPAGPTNGPVGAFLPLFPLLTRGLMPILGGDPILSGLVLNSVLTVVALTLIFRLAESDFGVAAGCRTLLLLGVGPGVFFLLSPLSEAAFLTFTLAAIVAARRGRIGLAAILAVGATLSRLQGILVMVPLLIEFALQARARHAAGGRALRWPHAALVLPPLSLLAFQWYIGAHGYPQGILAVEQSFWHAHLVVPGLAIWDSLLWVISHGDIPELINLLSVAALLACIPLMWRRLRPSDTSYAAVSLLVIVCHVEGFSPLMSALRFCLVTYPVWLLLGRSLTSPRAMRTAALVLGGLTLVVAVGITGYHVIE